MLDEKARKKILSNDERSPGYYVQHSQTMTMFVAKKVIFQENEIVSSTSVTEIGINDFPEMEDLNLRQNPIETEDREQIIDGLIVPSDQSASHESVSQ